MAGLATDGRYATCRNASKQMLGHQAARWQGLERQVQVTNSGKSGTSLDVSRCYGCRCSPPMFTTAAERIGRRCAVNGGQARAMRLGLGLTALAPHLQPRGHHHPRGQERLDFRYADNLFVPDFIFEEEAVSRCVRLLRRACMPSHARTVARSCAAGVAQASLYIKEARSAGSEPAGGRDARPDLSAACRRCAVNGG